MNYVNTCGKCRGLGFAICHCATTGGRISALGTACTRCGGAIYPGALHYCPDAAPLPEPWICPVCHCGVRGDVERCPCRAGRNTYGTLAIGTASFADYIYPAGGGNQRGPDAEEGEGEEA